MGISAKHPDGMPELGADPVSPCAAQGFTECTTAYLQQCQTRVDDLLQLGDHLAASAREYGKTEDQITASFRSGMRHGAVGPR